MSIIHDRGLSLLELTDGSPTDDEVVANIIFVHGLRGHAQRTWEAKRPDKEPNVSGPHGGELSKEAESKSALSRIFPRYARNDGGTRAQDSRETRAQPDAVGGRPEPANQKIFWPVEFLAADQRNARIWTYGYDADVIGNFFVGASKNSISQFGNDLMVEVISELDDEKPIIFVAHSLGGIIVKDALQRSKFTPNERYKYLFDHTKHVVFLGTPHRGSDKASWGHLLRNIASLTLLHGEDRVLDSLRVDSEILDNIHERFNGILHEDDLTIHSFYEAQGLTGTKGINSKVVGDFSSKVGHPTKEVVEGIDANHMDMVSFRSPNDEGYRKINRVLKRYIGDLGRPVKKFRRGAAGAEVTTEPREARELMKHLDSCVKPINLDLISDKEPGTLRWLLDDPRFTAWLSSDRAVELLWLRGGPGCGKSVAVKHVVDGIPRPNRRDCRDAVSCFLCDAKDEDQRKALAVVRSLLQQLLESCPSLLRSFGKHGHDYSRPDTFEAAKNLLLRFLTVYGAGKRFWILIDGFDELDEEAQTKILALCRSVAQNLESRCEVSHPHVKILISSRFVIQPERELAQAQIIDFDAKTVNKDIEVVVRSSVRTFGAREGFPDHVMSQIEQSIATKADGMFLWADLVWKRFKQVDAIWTDEVIDRQLSKLQNAPQGINELYTRLLLDMKSTDAAVSILTWILCARRPLQVKELEIALVITTRCRQTSDLRLPFDIIRSVITACGLFVRFEESDRTFRLVHHSLEEFFQRLSSHPEQISDQRILKSRIDFTAANEHISNLCLQYLCFSDIEWGPVDPAPPTWGDWAAYEEKCLKHPFLHYASCNWFQHMSGSGSYSRDEGVLQLARARYFATNYDYDVNTPHNHGNRLCHYAVKWSWDLVLEMLVKRKDCDFKALNKESKSVLHIASEWGQESTVQSVLETDAWMMAGCRDTQGVSVFDSLLQDLHLEWAMAKLLRRFNFAPQAINSRSKTGVAFLPMVVENGWLRVLDIALDLNGVTVDATDHHGRTAAHCAAIESNKQALMKLITAGSNCRLRDDRGRTVLHYGVQSDVLEITRMLIPCTDIHAADNEGLTPVHLAVSNDVIENIEILVAAGANLDALDYRGMSPFHHSALGGQPKVFKWFLGRKETNVNHHVFNGNTAVHLAALGRNKDIIRMCLYSDKIKTALTGQYRRNLAHLTVCWAEQALVQKIIQAGISVADTDSFGLTCLHLAARDAPDDVFSLVLDHYIAAGSDIDKMDRKGRSALHYAARVGGGLATRELMRHNADHLLEDIRGQRPSDIAAEYGAEAVLVELGWSVFEAAHACRPQEERKDWEIEYRYLVNPDRTSD